MLEFQHGLPTSAFAPYSETRAVFQARKVICSLHNFNRSEFVIISEEILLSSLLLTRQLEMRSR